MSFSRVAVVVVRLPDRAVVRFQGILGGEDGLATPRCIHYGRRELELWTTEAQLHELHAWLQCLPPELELEILGEHSFVAEGEGG